MPGPDDLEIFKILPTKYRKNEEKEIYNLFDPDEEQENVIQFDYSTPKNSVDIDKNTKITENA